MIPDNKQDLLDLISFALQEYGSSTLMKRELMEDSCVIKSFNSLNAKIHMVIAEKNKLYLRRYDVVDSNGENIVSFMLGHAAMLFAISAKKFREHLIATESIQGVITLKQSLFKQIVMPAAIILLDRKNSDTWLTSVETMEQLIGLMEGEIDERLTLYYTQDLSSDNMLPEYYNGDDKIIEHCFEGSETKELADIADIILGKGAKREDYKEQGIPYLRARDIQNGIIMHPEVSIDMAKKEQFAKQLIQEGDILLTKNFGQNKLANIIGKNMITKGRAGSNLICLLPFFVKIREHSKINGGAIRPPHSTSNFTAPRYFEYPFFTSRTIKTILR